MVKFRLKHVCHCPTRWKSMHVIQILSRWDTRSNEAKPSLTRKANAGEVYSIDFNKKS